MNLEEKKSRCIFCGKELSDIEVNNADDYGLHPETRFKDCCNSCDRLVTIPNRMLKKIVDTPDCDREKYIKRLISYLMSCLHEYEDK